MSARKIAGLLVIMSIRVCAFAQPPAVKSVGMRAGAVSPSLASLSAFSVGFRGETEENASSVFYQPYFDYWAATWHEDETNRNWRLFSAGISASRYFHLKNAALRPFLGGGIGVNVNTFSPLPVSGQRAADKISIDIDLSVHGLAGFLVPLDDNLSAVMELKYVAAGRADYAGLWLGVNYRIKIR